MLKLRTGMYMSAFGAALSAGAAAIEGAFERVEELFHFRHAVTGQECKFTDADQAKNFIGSVDDASDWAPANATTAAVVEPAAVPAGRVIEVNLEELHAAVAADNAAQDTPAAEPVAEPAAETPAAQ